MKSTDTESAASCISVYMQRKGSEPDKNSKAWLDWCYVYDRACKNMPDQIKRRVDAGQFDYQDFVAIWKATKEIRNASKVCKTG